MALVPTTSVGGSTTATWVAHTPTYTGFSGGVTTLIGRYCQIGNVVICTLYFSGTSNATTMTATLPVAAVQDTVLVPCYVQDNSAGLSVPGRATTAAASNILTFGKDMAGAAFTAAGSKGADVTIVYEV